MNRQTRLAALAISACLWSAACSDAADSRYDWPQFRGHRAAGVAPTAGVPVQWDLGSGDQVAWKTEIPGLGHASPIIWGDAVYVVTAISGDPAPGLRVGLYGDIASVDDQTVHVWKLYSLCKRTGRVLWERVLHRGVPRIKRHTKATHANATPATDGTHLIVSLGSEGLYCYDLAGNRLWKRDLGLLDSGYYVVPAAQWGFGSSPIIYRQRVILQCDVQRDSFLAAFDVGDGRQMWRSARQDVPTWSTPTIYEGAGRTELLVNGYRHAGGYDPLTGREFWRLTGGGDIPVCTPVAAGDLIILSSAHGGRAPLRAIRAGAEGDISPPVPGGPSPHIAWSLQRDGIYMQTPIVYGDYLYACKNNGVLSCFEVRTGKRVYRHRLAGGVGFTASAVAADGRLYFTSEEGGVYVVRAGPEFALLAENRMGEICMATPAITEGLRVIRTARHLYGIGSRPRPVQRGKAARSFAGGPARRGISLASRLRKLVNRLRDRFVP